MRVLVLNCGSSSLKFDVVATDDDSLVEALSRGSIDRIGGDSRLRLEAGGVARRSARLQTPDIAAAVGHALDALRQEGLLEGVEAVGHRVVHGGPRFAGAALIDQDVIAAIDELSELAPLHNAPALDAIRASQTALPELPAVACFDTSFFTGLPDAAALYAIPRELSEKYAIRRYGFHGLAHRSMVERYRELNPGSPARLISLQLGNGCSVTASVDGKPVETSMGFTPLEGLIMGTRSGDLDPSLPGFIATKEGMTPEEVDDLLNRRSGLLGLSGISSDMRDVAEAAERGKTNAALAFDAFVHRARKYVGAYLAVMGGADAVLFGGGIGQNHSLTRACICEGFQFAGLTLDAGRNGMASLTEGRISSDTSAVDAWVMDVDESSVIARDVAAMYRKQKAESRGAASSF